MGERDFLGGGRHQASCVCARARASFKMMTAFEKSAYRGSLLALLAIFVVVVAAGFIGERLNRGGSERDLEKAEGFVADLQFVATSIPRALDGGILRQGMLSTAWLADVGALPARLQAAT